jgi:PAS domain S-box-containing protein
MPPPAAESELLDQLAGVLELDAGLRVLLDALPDAIVVVDDEGRIVFAGQPIQDLAGYPPSELLGRPVEFLVPPELRESHVRTRLEFARAPTSRPMGAHQDIVLRHRDGTEVAVDISLSPIEAGGRRFVVAAVRGAGERRAAEQAVRRALHHEQEAAARLRNADEVKNSFLRAISHELRTPLTVVTGIAETLAARAGLLSAAKIGMLSRRLARNAERLDTLLADLLDVDRLSRGTLMANRQRTDVADLARRVVARTSEGNRPLVAAVPAHLYAEVDPALVERILENLLSNAVKYSAAGSPVTVRSILDLDAGGLLLVVDDEGEGVPEDIRESIFEPFFRGDDSSPAPGTGVGLSLVAEFAQLHGGRAWVEDREGGGASFRVLLPPPPPVPD